MLLADVVDPKECDDDEKLHGSEEPPAKRRKRPKVCRSRNWCFTDSTCTSLVSAFGDPLNKIRFLSYGYEISESGLHHHQGFVQFHDSIAMSNVKRRLALPSAHLEIMRGTTEEATDYTEKEGGHGHPHVSLGKCISMGQRVDVEELRIMIDEGKPMLEVARKNFPQYLRAHRALSSYAELVQENSTRGKFRELKVVVLAGRTGVGKTRLAYRYNPYIIAGSDLKWWDGYSNQQTVLIDDFLPQHVNIQWLLRLLDGYQLRLPVKCSHTYAQWTQVVITTNHAGVLFPDALEESRRALDRRITNYYNFFSESEVVPNVIAEFEALEVVEHAEPEA